MGERIGDGTLKQSFWRSLQRLTRSQEVVEPGQRKEEPLDLLNPW